MTPRHDLNTGLMPHLRRAVCIVLLIATPSIAAPPPTSPIRIDCQPPTSVGWSESEQIAVAFTQGGAEAVSVHRYVWARRQASGAVFDAVYLFRRPDSASFEFLFYMRGMFAIQPPTVWLTASSTLCDSRNERESYAARRTYNISDGGTVSRSERLMEIERPLARAFIEWLRRRGATATDGDLVPWVHLIVVSAAGVPGMTGVFLFILNDEPIDGFRRQIRLE
jgi:hypothetical protein